MLPALAKFCMLLQIKLHNRDKAETKQNLFPRKTNVCLDAAASLARCITTILISAAENYF